LDSALLSGRHGFSVLLYGLGSKRLVLEDFAKCVGDGDVVILHGFVADLQTTQVRTLPGVASPHLSLSDMLCLRTSAAASKALLLKYAKPFLSCTVHVISRVVYVQSAFEGGTARCEPVPYVLPCVIP